MIYIHMQGLHDLCLAILRFSGRNGRFASGYRPEDFIGKLSVVAAAANNSNVEYIALKRFYLGSFAFITLAKFC